MSAYDFSTIDREVKRRMEVGNTHHSLEQEELAEQLLLIEPEELEAFLDGQVVEGAMDWAADNLGEQRIRAIKNGVITLITIICRASIKHGVDPEFAYTLSDYYIEYLEKLTSPKQLADLTRQIVFHSNTLVRQAATPNYSKNINRAIEYISRNLYFPIQVSEVAEYVGLETHYFSTLFKKEVHLSPYRYILLKKLEAGKDLLKNTSKPVTYIAVSLGFCDASHFEKRFKEAYGITPLSYRKEEGLT